MEYLAVFIIGVVLGAVVVLIVNWMRRQEAKTIAQELIAQTESQKVQDLEVIINRVKEGVFKTC